MLDLAFTVHIERVGGDRDPTPEEAMSVITARLEHGRCITVPVPHPQGGVTPESVYEVKVVGYVG